MTRGLTDKQERILGFIVDYVNDQGYPPSIREIGNHFNISSLRGVTVHLDALERKGYIKRANTAVTEEEIIAYCKDNLARYKIPRQVFFVAEFPLSASGKVVKRMLREQIETMEATS